MNVFPRTRRSQRQTIRGVGSARVTSGYVDPATCTVTRNPARPSSRTTNAVRPVAVDPEQLEAAEYRSLCSAWDTASKGAAKRAALATLRSFEDRTGRDRYGSTLNFAHAVDVSTGSASWDEVK